MRKAEHKTGGRQSFFRSVFTRRINDIHVISLLIFMPVFEAGAAMAITDRFYRSDSARILRQRSKYCDMSGSRLVSTPITDR